MFGRRKGFTLIELLVVIAIILVLAAILFPIFASAQKAAQRSSCANNMKQCFLGVAQYASDNAGKVPPSWGTDPIPAQVNIMGEIGAPGTGWPGRILRYVKNQGIFMCPSMTPGTKKMLKLVDPATGNTLDATNPPTAYGLNARFMFGGDQAPDPFVSGGGNKPVLTSTLESPPVPSKCVLLIETTASLKNNDPSYTPPIAIPGTSGDVKTLNLGPMSDAKIGALGIRWFDLPLAPFGHTGGCNVVCADGHVKFVKAPTASANDATLGAIAANGMTWWK